MSADRALFSVFSIWKEQGELTEYNDNYAENDTEI